MANTPTIRLKVEVDQEKLTALEHAEERFGRAYQEMHESLLAVREAVRDLKDSLNVRRVQED